MSATRGLGESLAKKKKYAPTARPTIATPNETSASVRSVVPSERVSAFWNDGLPGVL